jgi:membrane protein YdbS with pleckstrin-like domain
MEIQNSNNINRIALVLAVVAFLLAVTAVLVKYFRHGEFDFATLAGGIVVPVIVISLVKSKPEKS